MSSVVLLQNQMRREALKAVAGLSLPQLGVVSSYNPNTYQVKAQLQPDQQETGWLPLATPWVGRGWGLFCPPGIGDLVDVQFIEGQAGAGYASLRYFNVEDVPLAVPSGEFWLVHQSGSFLKLTNDGKVALNGQVEIDTTAPTVNISCSAAANVTAPQINVGAEGAALSQLLTAAFLSVYAGHTHTSAAPGTATSVPLQLPAGVPLAAAALFDPATVSTTNLKAS